VNLHLHVERIVLDGFALGPAQRDELRAAIEVELAGRLADHGMAAALDGGGTLSELRAPAVQLHSLAPGHLAGRVAESVATALAPPATGGGR